MQLHDKVKEIKQRQLEAESQVFERNAASIIDDIKDAVLFRETLLVNYPMGTPRYDYLRDRETIDIIKRWADQEKIKLRTHEVSGPNSMPAIIIYISV